MNKTCVCCKQPRHQLHLHQSDLTGANQLMCNPCIQAGHEPRFLIKIASFSGINIDQYVQHKRYCGDELLAKELVAPR